MSIIKNSISIGFWTLLSRIFGYLRDVVIAFFLGAGPLNDAFIIALRIPNIFRSIFGEGALNSALVPIFSRLNKDKSDEEFKRFFISIQSFLIVALLTLVVIAEIFMPTITHFMASGYRNNPQILAMITDLSRITFPYIIFISLMAFYGGVANSLGNYFYFASAPIILNIVLVFVALIPGAEADKLWYLGYGIVFAGILEMIWVYAFLYKKFGLMFGCNFNVNAETKKAFSNFMPGVLAASAAQISIVVTTIIASFTEGGVSYLYYADRVYQLPLALIATALGTSLLPVLSRCTSVHDLSKFHALQNKSLMFVNLLTIPAAVLIFIYSYDIIAFLFLRGNFTEIAAYETSIPLKIFALCLPFFAVNRVFTACFQAVSDTRSPFRITVIGIIISITVSLLLMPFFSFVAVTIGAWISAIASTCLLVMKLLKHNRFMLYTKTLRQLVKVISFTVIAILITKGTFIFFDSTYPFAFLIECSVFGILYFALSKKFRLI